jgi:AcrR family transcriptional regulator
VGHAERRAVILEAAARLFGHYGPMKTTVADIAKAARVGVGTVYLEFRNKDSLLTALSQRRYQLVLDAMHQAWVHAPDAHTRIPRTFDARTRAFLSAAEESGVHGADLFGCSCAAVEAAHDAFCRAQHELLRSLIEGEGAYFRTRDADRSARALTHAYAAFAPPGLFERPRDRLAEELAALHELVLFGLLPSQSSS